MPEGDTLYRTAAILRPYLAGRVVTSARARVPGPRVDLLVGIRIDAVETRGKNLLIRFANGLELRTHLGMHGSWHRYRPGERWRRPPARAALVLDVASAVAVCFDAPVVELLETRAERLHPVLGHLGPDLLDPGFDAAEAVRRLRAPECADRPIAEVLLDQRALAGIGNVYKAELLFLARVNPFTAVVSVSDGALLHLVDRAHALLVANRTAVIRRTMERAPADGPGRGARWVYGRAGRPCRRCRTTILLRRHGDPPRSTAWCPTCQPAVTDLASARLRDDGDQGGTIPG